MRTRVLSLDDLTSLDHAAWQRLADRAVSPNAYLDPRFLAGVRHGFSESAPLRLIVAEHAGSWQGVLAVTTTPVHPRLPWRATTTGGDFMTSHADRHHPLLDRDHPTLAARALLDGMREAGLPRLVQLQHLPSTGPVADAIGAATSAARMPLVDRRRSWAPVALRHTVLSHSAPLGDEPLPLLLGHLTRDDARNTRRHLRGIARELGAPAQVDPVRDDPALEDEFIALQHAGWKGRTETGGASLRQHPNREHWFRQTVAAFRARGDLIGLRLAAGDHTLWIGYLLRSGDTWFKFLDAYAEQFRPFSPGTLGRLAAITHVFTQTDAPLFDPGFDARYTVGARLFPDRREQVDVVVATGGVWPSAVVRTWPWVRRARTGATSGRAQTQELAAAAGRGAQFAARRPTTTRAL